MDRGVPVGGFLPVSFLDWAGHVAPVLFLCGCNFRCPYCHNPDLVFAAEGSLDADDVVHKVLERKDFLDGIVISGGEPTIHRGFPRFLDFLKRETGLKVKIDTNGSNPRMLGSLIADGLIGAVSMDIKAPWRDYPRITGSGPDEVAESLDLLRRSGILLETRTTFVPGLMSIEDLKEIREQVGQGTIWVIQSFRPGDTLDPSFRNLAPPDPEILKAAFPGVIVR